MTTAEQKATYCPKCGVVFHAYNPSDKGELCNDCWHECYDGYDDEAWVTCRVCGYQYDENEEFICPNCGDWS